MAATHEREIPGNEDLAVELRALAQALVLAKDVEPEIQSGPEVRKVTLQVGPHKLVQVAQRELWDDGDLWVREITTSQDETGRTSSRFSELQMPKGGKITTGDIVFYQSPPQDVVEKLETLGKELSAGVRVPNKLFFTPIETHKRPSRVRGLVKQGVTRGTGVLLSRPKAA